MDFEYFLFKLLKNKSYIDMIWKPHGFKQIKNIYDNNKLEINKSLKINHNEIKKEYDQFLKYIYKKYPNLKKIKIKNRDKLVVRYGLIGALTNISLSIPNKLKKKLHIDHEMFGSFYNTDNDLTYNCLFSDLEGTRCKGDFYDYDPPSGKYLVNPPYTKQYIEDVGQRIFEWLQSNKKYKFVVVLPVWDFESRKELGLKLTEDCEIINKMIDSKYTIYNKILKNFKFYDGLNNKYVILKDPIHFFIMKNY